MPQPPEKLRRQYVNTSYPKVVLRFEDGHEIHVLRGTGKTFDAWAGETIKVLAVIDPEEREWTLLDARKADSFEPAG